MRRPDDLDQSRAAVAANDLTAAASGHLTGEVAMALPFADLATFKTLLKQFFSDAPWGAGDVAALDALVRPHVPSGWWQHDLGAGITLHHGIHKLPGVDGTDDGRYELWVTGGGPAEVSVFDRVFSGPVFPEATPHPRKVKFVIGGSPSPGVWHLRHDDPADPRVQRLFAEADVTDVMVAGDFVTVGLDRTSSWQERLDPVLELVTELFADEIGDTKRPDRTRDGLIAEGRRIAGDPSPGEDRSIGEHGSIEKGGPDAESGHGGTRARPALGDLHLTDPDDAEDRRRLLDALDADDARVRRTAVAVLAESADPELRRRSLRTAATDSSLIVRRTAVDAAADGRDEALRPLFVAALDDGDPWLRWKAVRSLAELGIGPSRAEVTALADDPDFQVRFEVARVLHGNTTTASAGEGG